MLVIDVSQPLIRGLFRLGHGSTPLLGNRLSYRPLDAQDERFDHLRVVAKQVVILEGCTEPRFELVHILKQRPQLHHDLGGKISMKMGR
jgi:hypothetical protein